MNDQLDTQDYSGPAPGVYRMTALDADLGFTNGSEGEAGKPQVAVLLQFDEGPHKGTTLTWYGFFTEKTKLSTIRALRTLGWESNDLSELDTVRGSAPCVVETEGDLEGVVRARVRFIGAGVLAMKNTMDDAQKKAFALSMSALAATLKVEPKKEPAAAGDAAKPATKKFF